MKSLKAILYLFACGILVSGLISCGGGGGGGGGGGDGGGGIPPVTDGSVALHNNSSVTIDYLYLTPSGQASWGPDLLSGALLSGATYTITGVPAGSYDGRAEVVGTYSIYYGEVYGFNVVAGSTYNLYAYNSSFSGSIKIVNNTVGANIIALYVVPSSSATWGPNQIASPIGPAGSMHLYFAPVGNYDVKVVWNVGPDSFYYNNSVTSLTLLTLYVI